MAQRKQGKSSPNNLKAISDCQEQLTKEEEDSGAGDNSNNNSNSKPNNNNNVDDGDGGEEKKREGGDAEVTDDYVVDAVHDVRWHNQQLMVLLQWQIHDADGALANLHCQWWPMAGLEHLDLVQLFVLMQRLDGTYKPDDYLRTIKAGLAKNPRIQRWALQRDRKLDGGDVKEFNAVVAGSNLDVCAGASVN